MPFVYSYGFSAAVNSYRTFGYACDGSESVLAACEGRGSNCAADSVPHAVAVRCGSNAVTTTGRR